MVKTTEYWKKIVLILSLVGSVIFLIGIFLFPYDNQFLFRCFASALGHVLILSPIILLIYSQQRWAKITFALLTALSIVFYATGLFMLTFIALDHAPGYGIEQRIAEKLAVENPSRFRVCEKYGFDKPEYSPKQYNECIVQVYKTDTSPLKHSLNLAREGLAPFLMLPLLTPFLLAIYSGGM